MQTSRKIILLLFSSFSFITVQAQDTVLYAKDSVIELSTNATILFFQENERLQNPAKTTLITKAKKTITLSSYLAQLGAFSEQVIVDLDGDNKKELVIYNYTAGPHCCDEIYIFKNTGTNKYQQAAKLFAGNTVILNNSQFYYDLHETFGNFFTCFACRYDNSSEEAPISTTTVHLDYKKGALKIVSGDQELRSRINDNLAKLGEQPYEKLDTAGQDNGLRKEVALNLAVFYYSFGKNITQTQALFNKHYKFPDAKKVWTEFVRILSSIKKGSDI